MKNSKIEWCDHTFNPWIGCTKVSPGCAHCYAEERDKRFTGGIHWGKGALRHRTSPSNWKEPIKWNREAEENEEAAQMTGARDLYRRPRVFCASLADWLDDEVPIEWLADLLELIRQTPNLDWLLLSKRPEDWRARILSASAHAALTCREDLRWWLISWVNSSIHRANIWIGTTVENQECADKRIPSLLSIPAKVRFLSCEPLLGLVSLQLPDHDFNDGNESIIDWVICGGESGPHARPMHPDWARGLRHQCKSAGVPFLFKQWGEWDSSTCKTGKHIAGRLLDGKEHNEFPKP